MADDRGGGKLDRRAFLGAAAGLGAAATAGQAHAAQGPGTLTFPGPTGDRLTFGAGGSQFGGVNRSESDLYDCEVEGKMPLEIDGAFFRIGPDPQYPKLEKYNHDIPFDGEGHLSMFRIKDGHVDYKSRYVKNQRWRAQHEARRSLFGMYRNPLTDDPTVQGKGISRGTANTQIFYHHNKLLVLKEDSPPVVCNPLTLETVDDYYTFGGGMKGETFTAHPKLDPITGELICFGYEAKGMLSRDIEVFSADKTGKVNWTAWVKAPYSCMIHDFAATQKHIAFLAIPLAGYQKTLDTAGPHWAWDSTLPTYLGVMRRGGDGKDMRWIKGPTWMATHTMGAFSDGHTLYFDMDGAPGNQFPFFPGIHEPYNAEKAVGRLVRMKVDMRSKNPRAYEMKTLFPTMTGGLSRQDDRFHTLPYRYGFMNGRGWYKADHRTGKVEHFDPGPDTRLAEMVFIPRSAKAPEGDGYLIGVATRNKESGRSDVLVLDTQDITAGPVATIKLPYRVVAQIHGFWVQGADLPKA